jgi:hypothetical protein
MATVLYYELDHVIIGDEGVGPHITTGDIIYVDVAVPSWEAERTGSLSFMIKQKDDVESVVFQKNYRIPVIISTSDTIDVVVEV